MKVQQNPKTLTGFLPTLVYLSVVFLFIFVFYAIFSLSFKLAQKKGLEGSLLTPEQILLAEEGLALMKGSDCYSCHKDAAVSVGPSYAEIAQKSSLADVLILKKSIIEGVSKKWGEGVMAPHPNLSDSDAEKMVLAVLNTKGSSDASAEDGQVEYRDFPVIGSRAIIWIVAQLHLLFAAFVLAVPIFALIIEFIGFKTGDKKMDKLAYEFTKLLSASFSFTAALGGVLLFLLLFLYPKMMEYLISVFGWTLFAYTLLFFLEVVFLYSYYYGWGKFSPKTHLMLGLGLNLVGLAILMVADSWLAFMNSPAGVDESGKLLSHWESFSNYTWMPLNIHRFISNISYGGSIAAAYGAFRFLGAKTETEKAHYDWMGYIGNFIAICAFLPINFAGYYFGSEIYAYSQNMGMVLMGGSFSWLFFMQGILIGMLFLGGNYYLWVGMERIEGAERFRPFIKYLLISIAICFAVWVTPHAVVTTVEEMRKIGGASHPVLGVLGVMSAKNTAVNILILTTYISFLLYRRGNKQATVSWAKQGNLAQFLIFVVTVGIVVFYGIYGYFVEAKVRIGFSVPQVLSVVFALVSVTTIDIMMYKNARFTGEIKWGKMPVRSQYVLFFIAVTFTWTMALMGYCRSGIRQHWHVYGIMRDKSADAFTPTLGYAGNMTSIVSLLFFGFIAVVFWLSSLSSRKDWEAVEEESAAP